MRVRWGLVALVFLLIADFYLLFRVGRIIGGGVTLLLVFAGFVAGWSLLQRGGRKAWRAFQQDVAERRPPGKSVTDGLLVVVGAVLLMIPGFLTDLIGLFLVFPPTRHLARAVAVRLVSSRISSSSNSVLFGPRQVRVTYGEPRRQPPSGGAGSGTEGNGGSEPTIEGEIIDPK